MSTKYIYNFIYFSLSVTITEQKKITVFFCLNENFPIGFFFLFIINNLWYLETV